MAYSRVTFCFVSGLAKIISDIICALNFKISHFYTHLYMHVQYIFIYACIRGVDSGDRTRPLGSAESIFAHWAILLTPWVKIFSSVTQTCIYRNLMWFHFPLFLLCLASLLWSFAVSTWWQTGVRIRWTYCFLSSLEASLCVWQHCR